MRPKLTRLTLACTLLLLSCGPTVLVANTDPPSKRPEAATSEAPIVEETTYGLVPDPSKLALTESEVGNGLKVSREVPDARSETQLRFERIFTKADPQMTVGAGILVFTTDNAAATYFEQRKDKLAERYKLELLVGAGDPLPSRLLPQIETPQPTPALNIATPFVPLTPAPLTPAPAKDSESGGGSPAPSAAVAPLVPLPKLTAGEAAVAYVFINKGGTRGYLAVWKQRNLVADIFVIGDQNAPYPDLAAMKLLTDLVEKQDLRIRAEIGAPKKPVLASPTAKPRGSSTASPASTASPSKAPDSGGATPPPTVAPAATPSDAPTSAPTPLPTVTPSTATETPTTAP